MGSVGRQGGRCSVESVSASRGAHSAGGAPAWFIDIMNEELGLSIDGQTSVRDAFLALASSGEDGRCVRGGGLNERRVSASRGTHSAGGAPAWVIDAMDEELTFDRLWWRQRQDALLASASSGEGGRCARGGGLSERR